MDIVFLYEEPNKGLDLISILATHSQIAPKSKNSNEGNVCYNPRDVDNLPFQGLIIKLNRILSWKPILMNYIQYSCQYMCHTKVDFNQRSQDKTYQSCHFKLVLCIVLKVSRN